MRHVEHYQPSDVMCSVFLFSTLSIFCLRKSRAEQRRGRGVREREREKLGFRLRIWDLKFTGDLFLDGGLFGESRCLSKCEMFSASMRKSFKDSLKVLEADIQHANTLASEFPREYDGACFQMRMSYSPAARLFLFLVQWTDCNLAGALGLLRILIYRVYVDGTTTMSTHERKASIREFYAVIFPSLMQLQRGITDMEEKKQKIICMERYKRRDDNEKKMISEIDYEREEECGICMEMNTMIVLPNCNHSMCLKCYRDWHSRSQSCPFCRDSLRRVNSGDLWIYTDSRDVIDPATVTRENLRRLFMYIDKLPVVFPDAVFEKYDAHVR